VNSLKGLSEELYQARHIEIKVKGKKGLVVTNSGEA